MTQPTEGLLERAVAGDADALSELLCRHGPAVERALRIDRAWRAVLEPADVMQVTYLEAFCQINRFDPDRSGSFEAWLRRIAENNLKDAIKGLKRKKQPQPRDRVRPGRHEDSLIGLYNLLGVTTSTPSRQARRREVCQMLKASIEALPEDYGQVIRLYDLEGRSIAEVAEALGRSPGAVHMLRARAHDGLRERLGSASFFFSSRA